jgi:hypothetical protein
MGAKRKQIGLTQWGIGLLTSFQQAMVQLAEPTLSQAVCTISTLLK